MGDLETKENSYELKSKWTKQNGEKKKKKKKKKKQQPEKLN